MAAEAYVYAEHLLATGAWEHSDSPDGENLAAMWSSYEDHTLRDTSHASDAWYDELYDPGYCTPGFSSGTGHFTQMVWANTTELGCGVAQGPGTDPDWPWEQFVVCRYSPPGNYGG